MEIDVRKGREFREGEQNGCQAEPRGRTVNEEAAGGFGRREKGRPAVREGLCRGGLTCQKRMLLLGWRQ